MGLAFAGSLTFGPASKKMKQASALLETAKTLPKGLTQEMTGKSREEMQGALEGVVRAYRVTQLGGVAVAGLNIALLVMALRRREKGTLVAAVRALVAGAVCFALTPGKGMGEDAIYLTNATLAISTVLAALFALLAGCVGGRTAAPVAARL